MSDSVTVDVSAPMQYGGDVRTVLESPRATMPPKNARGGSQPARPARADRADHQRIESEGIKYVLI